MSLTKNRLNEETPKLLLLKDSYTLDVFALVNAFQVQ